MRPSQELQNISALLKGAFKTEVIASSLELGELCVIVQREAIVKILLFLRDHKDLLFWQLMDVCGVDYPDRTPRFEVVYHLLSLKKNLRIRLKVLIEEEILMPTVTSVYSSANWLEREVWDMFGIKFEGHPDLRRLLTDYGFQGHPLRKDFPLTGYVEVRYDEDEKKVVYDRVQLPQEYRNFDFLSPWEGLTPEKPFLPGDEKASGDPV